MRPILDETHIHPAIRERIRTLHADVLDEVRRAISGQRIVVVGMKQNPFPRKARRLLDGRGLPYTYLEYGSYLSQWRRRNALKMWTGWPTMPQVFINGMLIGGADDLARLLDSGEIDVMLRQPYP
ncbi:MAG: glutaredoxin [Burkholderiaceae bacterium]